MDLNKVLIVGRVTAPPELRKTPGGFSVTSFSVATNRVSKDKNGNRREETEFHNVVAWGRQAEVASQFLTKGGMVLVEGRLQTRSWQDKQGGNRKTTEIVCERLQLGPKSAGGGGGGAPRGAAAVPGSGPDEGGDQGGGQSGPEEEIPVINLDEEPEQQSSDEIPF
jgi:single-strand DNA-binding protein